MVGAWRDAVNGGLFHLRFKFKIIKDGAALALEKACPQAASQPPQCNIIKQNTGGGKSQMIQAKNLKQEVG